MTPAGRTVAVPLDAPVFDGNERRYVLECLDTGAISSGAYVRRFERDFAAFVGARHAVACASGGAALHVALRLTMPRPRQAVPVSDLAAVGAANAVRHCGAEPLLVDCEPATWNVHAALLHDRVVRSARTGGPVPPAVVVSHVLGHPAGMEPLLDLRHRYGIRIVEDAAEALGATWRTGELAGRHVGTAGDLGCFSFGGDMIMTTGAGGMIVTDDADLAARARHLVAQARIAGTERVHDDVAHDHRLTNLAAAVGVAQLERLPAFLASRRRIARRYTAALSDLPVILPPRAPWADPTWWRYALLLSPDAGQPGRVVARLAEHGVRAAPLCRPLHRQPPYVSAPRVGGVIADLVWQRGIALPSPVDMTEAEQDHVVEMLCAVLGHRARLPALRRRRGRRQPVT